jgi:hypothetical protein
VSDQPAPAPALDPTAVQARADAATPGPWTVTDDGLGAVEIVASDRRTLIQVLLGDGDTRAHAPQHEADLAFIAAARTDVPALLATVKRQRRLVADLTDLVGDLADPDPCQFDHHGYCQAHAWFDTDPACPHGRARQLGLIPENPLGLRPEVQP